MEQKDDGRSCNLSLVGHLSELRKTYYNMVVAIIIGTGISYYYVDVLLENILKALQVSSIICDLLKPSLHI